MPLTVRGAPVSRGVPSGFWLPGVSAREPAPGSGAGVVEAGGASGHSENFAYVELDCKVPEGDIISAVIEGLENGRLQGKVTA